MKETDGQTDRGQSAFSQQLGPSHGIVWGHGDRAWAGRGAGWSPGCCYIPALTGGNASPLGC